MDRRVFLLIKGALSTLLVICFSFGVMPAKVCAIEAVEDLPAGFEEASSPEDGSQASPDNPTTHPPTVSFAGSKADETDSLLRPDDRATPKRLLRDYQSIPATGVGGPPLVDGLLSVKSNPVGAVIAAGLTLTFMTLRETGRVDLEGLMFLLNSMDFYAGLAGTVAGAGGQWGGVKIAARLKDAAAKRSPEMIAPLTTKEAFKTFSNVVNGFSYTLAVTSGFEVFSQFWKIATKNIPEARKVSDFVRTPWEIKKQVGMNLLYHCYMDSNLQKRVMDSIMYHRVMTFDFIAMNVGLYVGAQLGTFVARQMMPGNQVAQKVAPVLGSATGGLLVELMPQSWKNFMNEGLLSAKISRKQSVIQDVMATIQAGISRSHYPERPVDGKPSYWMSGVDLGSDIERIFNHQETLSGLHMQRAAARGEVMAWQEMGELSSNIEGFFGQQLIELTRPDPNLSELIETWVRENRRPQEIRDLVVAQKGVHNKRIYYFLMLDEARERAHQMNQDLLSLKAFMESAPDVPMPTGTGLN